MLHVIVPGHGRVERTSNLIHNLRSFRAQIPNSHCTIYVYNNNVPLDRSCNCTLIRRSGKWVEFMRSFESKFEYVVLMMDDILVKHVNLQTLLSKMLEYNLKVIAPSIVNWHHPIMQAGYRRHALHNNILGEKPLFSRRPCRSGLRATKYVDMLFVLFAKDAWECWSRSLDDTNLYGWGFDLMYWQNCRMRMAVDDTSSIEHSLLTPTSYSHASARRTMYAYIQRKTNMTDAQFKRYRFDILRSSTRCIRPVQQKKI
jgi:hypothetical protein